MLRRCAARSSTRCYASPAPEAIPADGPLDWALIPPRPRNAFWFWLEPAPIERGTIGWRRVIDGFDPDKVIGNSSIDLDLVELVEGTQDRLTVSARGRATWESFLAAGGEFPEDLPPF
ncbi:hypothetical protein [Consotaella salsifontis]|uniref:Uncharacterized protein n=1 Tax=Consotaella salsifontis TaxID=1365950 RepID=A0A1T4TFR6_9HYPH|nr:hypothetical protein [Consotaella salsifontis]SKA39267.1 hypothetical protein SAMN05428963_1304 [Consotaella salsifontis]